MNKLHTAWVTFDCYGTLTDWETGIGAFFREALGAEHLLDEWERVQFEMIQGPYRPYAQIMTHSLRQVLEAHRMPYREELGEAFVRSLATWRPFPETNPALERLRGKRLKLGIISNIDDALLRETVKHFTVPFDMLVTAEQARAYKPAAAGFRLALERIGLPPSQVTHVAFGDRYDLATARSCGMQVVFVNRHAKQIGTPVEAEIRSLSELPGVLERMLRP